MDLAEIEQNVSALDVSAGPDLVYDLLAAYGTPKASLTRLRRGSLNKAATPGDVLWKGKVFFRHAEAGLDPHVVIDDMSREAQALRENPRFVVVATPEQLLAIDRSTGDTLDVPLDRLHLNAAFFMPWAGFEKTQLEAAHYADMKAAAKMALLHGEIRRANEVKTDQEAHYVNVFFVRLLFCLFAEDTGVLQPGSLTESIARLTREDGSDLSGFLARFFAVLDTPTELRAELPEHLASLGYVNGALFSEEAPVPELTAKARQILIECGQLDWSEITPDIFGSMMQGVVRQDVRAEAGMHYTSVANILKVLRPLFLDALREDLQAAGDDPKRLEAFISRLASTRVFDPACGSGNFLVVAYRELRLLEISAMERLRAARQGGLGDSMFDVSRVDLANFVGIELDDFAHEVAQLSLWIAKHQMNRRFADRFGVFPPLIPLKEAGRITCGNAARLPWEEVCPPDRSVTTYICGNPPYLGSTNQSASQKADIREYFDGRPYSKKMDYVGIWVLKTADYISMHGGHAGLVTTNSVCQGDHVGMLFPTVYSRGLEISFAETSFPWTNDAQGNAGVTCIVLGLSARDGGPKRLTSDGSTRTVQNIGPYLLATPHNTIVYRSSRPIGPLPPMTSGSKPSDGGHLILTERDRDDLLSHAPSAERFVRSFVGGQEFMGGTPRWCLWIERGERDEAESYPAIRERLQAVAAFREASTEASTRGMADQPHRFYFSAHQPGSSIIVPSTTSMRRRYVPVGFLDDRTVISNGANAIYGAPIWIFGVLQSALHMAWLRTVGGRLRTDYRYSAVLVYNTFPMPLPSDEARAAIANASLDILAAREQFPSKPLSELYDPDTMPAVLAGAHAQLDEVVDAAFGFKPGLSDDARAARLLEAYDALLADRQATDA